MRMTRKICDTSAVVSIGAIVCWQRIITSRLWDSVRRDVTGGGLSVVDRWRCGRAKRRPPWRWFVDWTWRHRRAINIARRLVGVIFAYLCRCHTVTCCTIRTRLLRDIPSFDLVRSKKWWSSHTSRSIFKRHLQKFETFPYGGRLPSIQQVLFCFSQ